MSESLGKPMSKNELSAITARLESEKYGKKTDLIKFIVNVQKFVMKKSAFLRYYVRF